MKKIMFGLAAAIAMVATADIVSSNIVGYSNNSLQQGGTIVAPQFLPCGGGEIDLQSLVATGEDASDSVQIQLLDSFGRTVTSYDWINWYENEAGKTESCWVDGDFKKVSGVSFTAGQGLFVMGSSVDQTIQSAGEVSGVDVNVSLQQGGTVTGNPFPISVDLQDIVATGEDASDSVQIQLLDSFGRTAMSYDWINWYENEAGETESCWVDGDFKKVSGVTFAPGQGLFVMGSSVDQGIQFPAPEL